MDGGIEVMVALIGAAAVALKKCAEFGEAFLHLANKSVQLQKYQVEKLLNHMQKQRLTKPAKSDASSDVGVDKYLSLRGCNYTLSRRIYIYIYEWHNTFSKR